MDISASREIAAPARRVWDLLVDWERQGEWMPLTKVRVLPGPREGLGTRLEAVTGVGPAGVTDPMEVVDWAPPGRCVVRHDGRVLRGTGTFEIEPLAADRCRFTWREDLTAPGGPIGEAVFAGLGRVSTPFFGYALARLAKLAER
ncbi:SRPBCC family protein [Actinopolymorpha singaporensis]